MKIDKPPLAKRDLLLLIITQCGLALPHVQYMAAWIPVVSIMLALMRWGAEKKIVPSLPRWAKLTTTVLATIGVIATFGTFMGREAGTATLLLMLGLKLHELNAPRDVYFSLILNYFLVAATFLYTQTPFIAMGMMLATLSLTTLMIRVNRPRDQASLKTDARLAGVLLLQSFPLMLGLFILFPRIPGPLWSLPKDAQTASTGLSDRIRPGSITSLTQSNAIAFRVEFDGTIPFPPTLYWRGPVFANYDGDTWYIQRPDPSSLRQNAASWILPEGESVTYTMTLEPNQQNWLFPLDAPLEILDLPHTIAPDLLASTSDKITSRVRYRGISYPVYQTAMPLNDAEREQYLYLPANHHPKAKALGEKWRQQFHDDDAIIANALMYFNVEPFIYSLNPAALGKDSVDSFLFDTRKGFCEHYATAFTVLMRAAGIPTRLIAGYQGGEVNPVGNYLIVRQADAHSWVEVWHEGRGWVRQDPTAAVAPSRIQLGLESALSDPGELPMFVRKNAPWINKLRYQLDSVQNTWNQWVVGYGQAKQTELLSPLGLKNIQHMSAALAILIVTFLASWTIALTWRQRKTKDRIQHCYLKYCEYVAKQTGITRRQSEGPLDFSERVAAAHPRQRQALQQVAQRYILLRYGKEANDNNLIAAFERECRLITLQNAKKP